MPSKQVSKPKLSYRRLKPPQGPKKCCSRIVSSHLGRVRVATVRQIRRYTPSLLALTSL